MQRLGEVKKSHDELLQDVIDFVEGRLDAAAFRDLINADPAYGDVVNDDGLEPGHWSHLNREPTYVVMMMAHYDDPTQVQPIRGYLRRLARTKGPSFGGFTRRGTALATAFQ